MKKKNVCLILCAIMLLFAFSACKNKNREDDRSNPDTTKASDTTVSPESDKEVTSQTPPETKEPEDTKQDEEKEKLKYEIKKTEEDITVKSKKYGTKTFLIPSISGLEDKEKEARINALTDGYIKNKVNKLLPSSSFYKESDTEPEVKFEIKAVSVTYLSDYLLSAKIESELTISEAPHPELYVFTVNIDIENEKALSSSDIIKNFDSLKEDFKNGKFAYEYGDKNLILQTNNEDMIMQYYSEYEIYPYFYFADNRFCLNIELVYALGGNAGFSLPYKDAENYLNTKINAISKILK